jgi:hypothetical protein
LIVGGALQEIAGTATAVAHHHDDCNKKMVEEVVKMKAIGNKEEGNCISIP